MDEEWIDIPISKERKTWVKGVLHVKCKSIRKELSTDHQFQNTYTISKVLQSKLNVLDSVHELLKNQEKYKQKFKSDLIECDLKLPAQLNTFVSQEKSSYRVNLKELKFIRRPKVSNVVLDEDYAYSTYEGEVIGYTTEIIHSTKRVKKIKEEHTLSVENSGNPDEVVYVNDEPHKTPFEIKIPEGEYLLKPGQNSFKKDGALHKFEAWSDGVKTPTRSLKLSGTKKLRPIYSKKQLATGDKQHAPLVERVKETSLGCMDSIRTLFGICLALFIVWALITALGVNFLYLLGVILVIYLLSTYSDSIIRGLGNIFRYLRFALMIGFVGLLLSYLFNDRTYDNTNYIPPKPAKTELVEAESDQVLESEKIIDTLLVQNVIWSDYQGREYETDLKIRKYDYYASKANRNKFGIVSQNNGFGQLYLNVMEYDQNDHFKLVYDNLDTIRLNRGLDSLDFAKAIVSMVQSISYTLILPANCDSRQYADLFIQQYLESNKPCEPNVKNGLYSPEEFIVNLKGDCDTRTLALFKILKHYDYDVRILNSEEHQHSILGLNLAGLKGRKLIYDGKAYTPWETTEKGIEPGTYFPYLENQKHWQTAIY